MFTAFDTIRCHLLPRALLFIAICCSGLLPGCRSTRDNQFDLLERELRTQEDYIYELEDYVVEYSEKLRQCRCSRPLRTSSERTEQKSIVTKSKPTDKADDDHRRPLEIDDEPLREPGEDLPDPSLPEPETEPMPEADPQEFEIPPLEIEEPIGRVQVGSTTGLATYPLREQMVVTENELLLIPDPAIDDPLAFETHQARPPLADDLQEDHQVRPAESQSEVTQLAERVVVKGLFRSDADDVPLTSLLAVVEAQDEQGEPVEFTGEVSLMVMTADAKKPWRLKRWDFLPEDAVVAWQSSHLGDGLHLELPLGEIELPEEPLEMWVRLVDAEGRKLLSQLPFESEQLAALEPETGAQELQPETTEQLAQHEEPTVDDQAEPEQPSKQPGWRTATGRSDTKTEGYTSTASKSRGWTAQSTSSQILQSRLADSPPPSTPVWRTGRLQPSQPRTTQRGSQPQWSPFR